MRSPRKRLKWFLNNRPIDDGMCLNHTWRATDIPNGGRPSAASALAWTRQAGKLRTDGKAPFGAWLYWSGGSDGNGHVALSARGKRIASTDVKGPATTGVVEQSWPVTHWGLRYEGWTDWYGVTFTVGTFRQRRLAVLRKRVKALRAQIGKLKRHHK